jgi:hypothetical protein
MSRLYSRVILVEPEGQRSVLFSKDGDEKPRKKRRRVSRLLRPFERAHHDWLRASKVFASDLLRRHRKSRTRKRDRWLSDVPVSFLKAQRKGLDEL